VCVKRGNHSLILNGSNMQENISPDLKLIIITHIQKQIRKTDLHIFLYNALRRQRYDIKW